MKIDRYINKEINTQIRYNHQHIHGSKMDDYILHVRPKKSLIIPTSTIKNAPIASQSNDW